jgi:hypothetical protein
MDLGRVMVTLAHIMRLHIADIMQIFWFFVTTFAVSIFMLGHAQFIHIQVTDFTVFLFTASLFGIRVLKSPSSI